MHKHNSRSTCKETTIVSCFVGLWWLALRQSATSKMHPNVKSCLQSAVQALIATVTCTPAPSGLTNRSCSLSWLCTCRSLSSIFAHRPHCDQKHDDGASEGLQVGSVPNAQPPAGRHTSAAGRRQGSAARPARRLQHQDECRALDPLRQQADRINTSLYCQTI